MSKRVKKMLKKVKRKEQGERLELFVSRHREMAFNIDLPKESYHAWEKLETQKSKYVNAELVDEIKEVNSFCSFALKKLKIDISKYIRDSKETKARWVNCTPPFLIKIRLFLEYNNLFYNTINPKLSLEGVPIEKINHSENRHNILYNIHNQLGDIKKLIDTQIKTGFQIYNYYVCENKYTLLDTHVLMVYLTEKKIENTYLLKSINTYCFEIMELWNNKLHKIPEKKLKVWFHYHDDKREFSINSQNDFYAIYLDERFQFYNNKKQFFGSYNFKHYTAHAIATKCHSIINKITAAYPKTASSLKEQNRQFQQSNESDTDEVYKTQNLFKVGLLFAKGEMNKYFTVTTKGKTVMNENYSAPKIAKELGNESYNKWVLASINNYSTDNANGNKNIFNSTEIMSKIISHCEAKKIPVDPYFKSRIPTE